MPSLRGLGPRANRAFERLAKGMALLGGLVVVILMVVMTADALGRKFIRPLPGAFEASEAMMIGAVFLPLVYVQMRRENIFVGIVTQRLSPRTQAILDGVCALLGLGLFGLLTWLAWDKAWYAWSIREYRVGIIMFPIWPFRWLVPLGTGLLSLQLALTAAQELTKAFRHR